MAKEPKPRQILLDAGNNIFTIVASHETLQQGLDRLVKLVEAQGKMDLCVGSIHCLFFQETPVRLHLKPKKKGQRGCTWAIGYQ